MILALAAAAAAAAAAQSTSDLNSEIWPTARAGAVRATPDWSDYRIYPRAALRKDQEGLVVPELLVGPDGTPVACRIVKSSQFAELDAGSCSLMMQMRFEPARDAVGLPVPSRYSRPLLWGLTDPRPFASSMISARVSIEHGRFTRCEVIGGEGPYVAYWSALACYTFRDPAYFFGARKDENLDATIEVRLDAGDGAPFLHRPARGGLLSAEEKVSFAIDAAGAASNCTPLISRGFGPRGMNNLSPCGRLLSTLWFKDPPKNAPPKRGLFETRVLLQRAD